jgi:16S rRNA (cytidine1402-2'-O)-methyltransferase
LTVVISKKNINNVSLTNEEIILEAKKYLKKYTLKDVVELLSKKEKISKKKVYDICLKLKND